ncbi:MAG: IclR family acetate operon transcriptional repressor [Oceanospirillaceae bacterium]|jgi:IclR family acetate operon transcriptional repressor
MSYLYRVQTNWPLRIHLPVDSHAPVWPTASGKLYLSFLPKDCRHRLIDKLPVDKLARHTLIDSDSLERQLLKIQADELETDNE